MTILNESLHTAEFLLSEAALYRSREVGNISAGNLKPGTILTLTAEEATARLTGTAKSGGNTGNGVFTADPTAPVGYGSQPGTYTVRATVVGTNSATFRLSDPNGAVLSDVAYSGAGAIGAFNDQIKFTITDGSTDFVVGDGFDITISQVAGANQLDTYTAAVAGGAADAVLYGATDATSAPAKGTIIARDAEVFGEFLVFPDSSTDTQKRAIEESFKRHNIRVRWTSPPVA